MRAFPFALSGLIAGLLFTTIGCGNVVVEISRGSTASRTDEFSVSVPPERKCEIQTKNGFIHCEAGDVDEIQVAAKVSAKAKTREQAEADLERITIERAEIDEIAQVIAKVPERVDGSVAFTVTVPKDLEMDVKTSNGQIKLTGLTRDTSARTSNGEVILTDCEGAAEVRTTNGRVTLDGSHFEQVDAITTNGAVKVRGRLAAGEHQLQTSNGSIRVETTGPPVKVTASTSNGRIRANGKKVKSGETIVLGTLDADSSGAGESAELTLRTSNGSIDVEHDESSENEDNDDDD